MSSTSNIGVPASGEDDDVSGVGAPVGGERSRSDAGAVSPLQQGAFLRALGRKVESEAEEVDSPEVGAEIAEEGKIGNRSGGSLFRLAALRQGKQQSWDDQGAGFEEGEVPQESLHGESVLASMELPDDGESAPVVAGSVEDTGGVSGPVGFIASKEAKVEVGTKKHVVETGSDVGTKEHVVGAGSDVGTKKHVVGAGSEPGVAAVDHKVDVRHGLDVTDSPDVSQGAGRTVSKPVQGSNVVGSEPRGHSWVHPLHRVQNSPERLVEQVGPGPRHAVRDMSGAGVDVHVKKGMDRRVYNVETHRATLPGETVAIPIAAPQNVPIVSEVVEGSVRRPDQASRVQLVKIVEQAIAAIVTIESKNLDAVVVTLRYPPLFEGSTLSITEFSSTKKEFNLAFSDLPPDARRLIESMANQQQLRQILVDKGYILHTIRIEAPQPFRVEQSSASALETSLDEPRRSAEGDFETEEEGSKDLA